MIDLVVVKYDEKLSLSVYKITPGLLTKILAVG